MLLRWLINAVAIFFLPYLVSGIRVDGFLAALVAALILGIVNAVIRPIFLFLTLPINFLTLGLFTFVINAFMLSMVAGLVQGFYLRNFWSALVGSLFLSLISSFLTFIVRH
ncbi:MAG: phage holin family protein [Firmicutes bacterium]|nr:phage holin family protein [Bacillota bacterium]MCL5039873.1 phage holin family protein [Bacillota bacterium]